jgi:hypothetical protein
MSRLPAWLAPLHLRGPSRRLRGTAGRPARGQADVAQDVEQHARQIWRHGAMGDQGGICARRNHGQNDRKRAVQLQGGNADHLLSRIVKHLLSPPPPPIAYICPAR